MVVTAMAIHLDASRLLLRRDHTVLHEVHDFHQFRSLIRLPLDLDPGSDWAG